MAMGTREEDKVVVAISGCFGLRVEVIAGDNYGGRI
jgi:hypothetical protein